MVTCHINIECEVYCYFKWRLIQNLDSEPSVLKVCLWIGPQCWFKIGKLANNEERSTSAEWQKKRGRWEAFICSLFYFLQWESAAKHGSMSVSPNVFSLEVNCQTGATQLHSMFRGKWLVMNMEMCLLSVACTHIGKFMKDRHTHIYRLMDSHQTYANIYNNTNRGAEWSVHPHWVGISTHTHTHKHQTWKTCLIVLETQNY